MNTDFSIITVMYIIVVLDLISYTQLIKTNVRSTLFVRSLVVLDDYVGISYLSCSVIFFDETHIKLFAYLCILLLTLCL